MVKMFTPQAVVYAIASVLLVLQLVLAVQKYLSKPSMTSPATTPFATKSPVRAARVLPDEYLGEQGPLSQYRAPTSGAKTCSFPLLENAIGCAIPGGYSEQMFNGMDIYICSVTLYL